MSASAPLSPASPSSRQSAPDSHDCPLSPRFSNGALHRLAELALSRRLLLASGRGGNSTPSPSRTARLRAAELALRQLRSTIAGAGRELDQLHAQEIRAHMTTLALSKSGARADVELRLTIKGYAIARASFGDRISRFKIYPMDDARAARDGFGYFANSFEIWTCRGLRELRCYADALPRRTFTDERFPTTTGHDHLRLLAALQRVYGQSGS